LDDGIRAQPGPCASEGGRTGGWHPFLAETGSLSSRGGAESTRLLVVERRSPRCADERSVALEQQFASVSAEGRPAHKVGVSSYSSHDRHHSFRRWSKKTNTVLISKLMTSSFHDLRFQDSFSGCLK
jgi:hypothetical protein